MMLLLDYRNDGFRICVIEGKKGRWTDGAPVSAGFVVLDRVMKSLAKGRRKPRMIGVTVSQAASWSTMRAAVASANGLAFAWNIPVIEVPVGEGFEDDALVAAARNVASRPRAGRWAYPAYGGEPHITVPKQD
jgi:hypothetical protein